MRRLALAALLVALAGLALWLAQSGGRPVRTVDPVEGRARARAEGPPDDELLGAAAVDEAPVQREPVVARVRRASEPGRALSAARELEGTMLCGTVVTRSGRPLEGALVKAIPLFEGGVVRCVVSEASGRFCLEPLVPARYRVLALGSLAASPAREFVIAPGSNDAGKLVLPVEDSPGTIRGRVVAHAGDDPFGVVLVSQVGGERRLAVPIELEIFGGDDDGAAEFELVGLPPGDYLLTLVTLDGRRYEPERLFASPPAEDLEFRASADARRGFALELRAADTDAVIEPAVVLARIQDQWVAGVGDEHDFPFGVGPWIAYAPGFRPERGDFTRAGAFREEDWGRIARVEAELEPGFGLAVLFKDAASPALVAPQFEDYFGAGIPRAQVLADGKVVATSDADGLALVDLPRAPTRLEFRKVGWRLGGEREEDGVRWVHMIRE